MMKPRLASSGHPALRYTLRNESDTRLMPELQFTQGINGQHGRYSSV